ncbi:hypothetical protein GCM10008107_14700 [Psychrosphaera saromensis]|uniref:Uncharacterized protein n=1 Tax=Psychrosphaera saromensis TaxID=716813 RepID=A0A2S7UTJ5_9GAMM|nr:hypothetical protein [Psychrosphaera saromensis]PQJ53306.1 hypothetical protein BTO11_06250 [Psychrosphaera saromensis]GHB66532.1 hypothetical protein GCM10008107_14700 [Psychrosphaera saromensis]GLQ14926.1 hypothetical protein GCM10007917_23810 [Psychrosphaera saromensis]
MKKIIILLMLLVTSQAHSSSTSDPFDYLYDLFFGIDTDWVIDETGAAYPEQTLIPHGILCKR